nr:unnamed protein product [Digitaria exilis]
MAWCIHALAMACRRPYVLSPSAAMVRVLRPPLVDAERYATSWIQMQEGAVRLTSQLPAWRAAADPRPVLPSPSSAGRAAAAAYAATGEAAGAVAGAATGAPLHALLYWISILRVGFRIGGRG